MNENSRRARHSVREDHSFDVGIDSLMQIAIATWRHPRHQVEVPKPHVRSLLFFGTLGRGRRWESLPGRRAGCTGRAAALHHGPQLADRIEEIGTQCRSA